MSIVSEIRTIKNTQTGSVYEVDESKCVHDMMNACPRFFNVKHGKRESYSDYRGFLIVRNTVKFSDCKPARRTTVYAFSIFDGHHDLLCVSAGTDLSSVHMAKRLIDKIIDGGEYYYGICP